MDSLLVLSQIMAEKKGTITTVLIVVVIMTLSTGYGASGRPISLPACSPGPKREKYAKKGIFSNEGRRHRECHTGTGLSCQVTKIEIHVQNMYLQLLRA